MIIIRKPAHKLCFVLMLTALLSFPMINCNNQGSGDSSSDFAVQPGDVTDLGPDLSTITTTSFDFNFDNGTDNTPYDCGTAPCYAILYSGSHNGTDYIGIAASPNPND